MTIFNAPFDPRIEGVQMHDAAEASNRFGLRKAYDAIVLGTGLGGATAARRLVEHGLEVLLVEQGESLSATASPAEPSRYILDVVGSREAPLSFVGGRTKFYGAALYRFREGDFQARQLEVGVSPAWPFSYKDLAPFYADAERIYKVHGAPDGDPTDPRGEDPYPHPPVPLPPLVAKFEARLRASGTSTAPVPRGVDFAGGRCTNCPSCDGYLCTRNAKMDAEVAAVQPALTTGNLHLSLNTRCERVVLDPGKSRARACVLVRDGTEIVVEAAAIIVAGGMVGTAELLLRSRTDRHPDGLGNNNGQVGRNLSGHSTGMVFPFVSLAKLPALQTKSFAINALYDGARDWPYPVGVIQLAGQTPFWREASRIIRPIAKLVSEHCFTMFYMAEAAPLHEAGLVFDGDRVVGQIPPAHSLKTFEYLRSYAVSLLGRAGYPALARRRPPYLWHEVGTTRMGEDPLTSVVDPNGEVHDIKGLYIADAGVLPTAGAVNTGLTIAAVALKTADAIIKGHG